MRLAASGRQICQPLFCIIDSDQGFSSALADARATRSNFFVGPRSPKPIPAAKLGNIEGPLLGKL
jgi:hypothetical protein